MTTARLAAIDLPDFGMPDEAPELPASLYADRLERLRDRASGPASTAWSSTRIASTARTCRT